jgi:hypothetical protein
VEVFPLGVDDLAEPARAIDLTHRVAVIVVRRRLEHHVLAAARFDRLVQLVGLLDRAEDGRHGAGDVLAVLEHLDAVLGMAGCVGRHEDRLDRVVLDQLFERRVRLLAATGPGQRGAALGEQVADGDDGDVGMVLEAERGAELADAIADDPHADLPVGDRLPGLPGAIGRLDTPGAEDLRAGLLGFGRGQQAIGRDRPERAETKRAQERSSRVGVVHHRFLRGRGWCRGRGDRRPPRPGAV